VGVVARFGVGFGGKIKEIEELREETGGDCVAILAKSLGCRNEDA
jgi:hypothetical protein